MMNLNKGLVGLAVIAALSLGAGVSFGGDVGIPGTPDLPPDTTLLPFGGAGGTYHGPGDTVPGYTPFGTAGGAGTFVLNCGTSTTPCIPSSLGFGQEWFHKILFPDSSDVNCVKDVTTGQFYLSASYSFTIWDALRLNVLNTTGALAPNGPNGPGSFIDPYGNVSLCYSFSLPMTGAAIVESQWLTNGNNGVLSSSGPDERVRLQVCKSVEENSQLVIQGLVPGQGVHTSNSGCTAGQVYRVTFNLQTMINAALKLDAAGIPRTTSLINIGPQTCVGC